MPVTSMMMIHDKESEFNVSLILLFVTSGGNNKFSNTVLLPYSAGVPAPLLLKSEPGKVYIVDY